MVEEIAVVMDVVRGVVMDVDVAKGTGVDVVKGIVKDISLLSLMKKWNVTFRLQAQPL